MTFLRQIAALLLANLCLLPSTWAAKVSYNFDIKPILSDRCFLCHGFDEAHRAADLRLDIPEAAYAEKDGSTPIVPGDPGASEIWQRIISTDPKKVMPTPESHLSLTDAEKELIRKWIEQGAEYEKHWAFVPPQRPELPSTKDDPWVANPIDAFVLAKLQENELQPSPPANPSTLARRLALDLTGLPPTSDLADDFSAQIEKLLKSPHFGERWALPWLDAARYADSNGFQGDPNNYAYPWRDYLIRALNDNKPYDELITELIAGDLLENPTQDQLVATAFNRLHPIVDEGGSIKAELLFNYRVDRVDAVATSFLGLTFACAQCHDHKYDPISHKDYFSFMAFFSNMDEEGQPREKVEAPHHFYKLARPTLRLDLPEITQRLQAQQSVYDAFLAEKSETADAFETAFIQWAKTCDFDEEGKNPRFSHFLKEQAKIVRRGGKLNSDQRRQLTTYFLEEVADNEKWLSFERERKAQQKLVDAIDSQVPRVMIMREQDKPATMRLHDRGLYDAPKGDPLPAGIPAAIGQLPEGEANRLTLANWMVSAENPLTARVLVNRIWQEIFGTGIVSTPEDFGFQSALPSHPELLDWLAVEFRESGWDFKHIVRLILQSNTYRQTSATTPELQERDPANVLLARGPRFRLPSSLIRDYALAVSGLLDRSLYGAPAYPSQPGGLWKEVSFGRFGYPQLSGADQQYRRSLYTFWRRTMGPPNMFDAANRQMCSVKPSRTNTPLQALTLLNDPIYLKAAVALANTYQSAERPLYDIFFAVTRRQPTEQETTIITRTYDRELAHFKKDIEQAQTLTGIIGEDSPHVAALTLVSQMLLNLDESITKE